MGLTQQNNPCKRGQACQDDRDKREHAVKSKEDVCRRNLVWIQALSRWPFPKSKARMEDHAIEYEHGDDWHERHSPVESICKLSFLGHRIKCDLCERSIGTLGPKDRIIQGREASRCWVLESLGPCQHQQARAQRSQIVPLFQGPPLRIQS